MIKAFWECRPVSDGCHCVSVQIKDTQGPGTGETTYISNSMWKDGKDVKISDAAYQRLVEDTIKRMAENCIRSHMYFREVNSFSYKGDPDDTGTL